MPGIKTFVLCALLCAHTGFALDHSWSDASKQAVGTAYGKSSSKVWFTIGHGILNEVYYPRIDRAQVGDSQLLFTNVPGASFLEEKRDFAHEISHPPGIPRPVIHSTYGSGDNLVEFTKEVITDPALPVLRIRYQFTSLPEGTRIYILHKPAADNDGGHDLGTVFEHPKGKVLFAWDEQTRGAYQALLTNAQVRRASVGVVGETDGWQDLSRFGRMVNEITANGPGNLAFIEEVTPGRVLEIALGFGDSRDSALNAAALSLQSTYNEVRQIFDDGWQGYLRHLDQADWLQALSPSLREDTLWNAAVIKAHEDKLNPGAIVASLSIPNLPDGRGAGDGKNTGGYHLVWPRDLFKSGLALLRLGDTRTALNVLSFMSRMEHDGHISQNSWVDGRPFWNGEQMDQEAFPVLLGYELVNAGVTLSDQLKAFLNRRVSRLQHSSGFTGQERWEEARGFSPNTLAVMAAALSRAGDQDGAKRLLDTALRKTVSYRGPLSAQPYFVRISESGNPDDGNYIQIANGGPALQEYRVLDGGFLEWLRWFPNPQKYFGNSGQALDAIIRNTLPLYDDPANGVARTRDLVPVYHRYTSDAYGVNHVGGPWPILTLERALPELASNPRAGFRYIDGVRQLWGKGDMCPEQLMGSQPMPYGASPLVWCHAELIELAHKTAKTLSK